VDASLVLSAAFAGAIAASVGAAEIMSRYRQQPLVALLSAPGAGYVFFNAGAGAAALLLLELTGWITRPTSSLSAPQVFLAGFGSMTVLRTSVFTASRGSDRLTAGPSTFLENVLLVADEALDRKLAVATATSVSRIMSGVSFDRAHESLPSVCLSLRASVPNQGVQDLGTVISGLRNGSTLPDSAKATLLGTALLNLVGPTVLEEAVRTLAPSILVPERDESNEPSIAEPPTSGGNPIDVPWPIGDRERG
jgi:hypothetical protein